MAEHQRPTSAIPLLPKGVFTISGRSVIDAPISKVWSILLDWPTYEKWNPFTRAVTRYSRTGQFLTTAVPTETGQKMTLIVHIPPTMDSSKAKPMNGSDEIIHVSHEDYQLAWIATGWGPRWLMYAERWQVLSVDEEGRTVYETEEVFSGLLSWLIWWLYGKDLQAAITAVAEALKGRAESL